MNIKYKNWSEITIHMFDEITNIIKDESLSMAEKDIAIVALLCEVDEDEIWDMSVDDVNRLRNEVLWVGAPTNVHKKMPKKIKIGEFTLVPQEDIASMSYSQYVDFETYIKADKPRKEDILTTILIPENRKYNDGYDIAKVRDAIYMNMSIEDADSICFFFTKRLVSSIKSLLSCLSKKKTMNKKERESIMEIRKQTLHMLGYLSLE